MKKFHFLQIFGFTIEIFSFVAIVISLITNTGSRGPLYLLFLVGVLLVASGNLINRNKK
ncbi:MAG: hypothetical protein J6B50_11000 [Lachnospiraceae bacterium]|nr:hypothetical protein [Lachnospiraceae bacterium]MBP3504910.1 hypothetical protein [Lachnospiraceae bacterium]